MLSPLMAMPHCRTGNVGKPAYKTQAYTDTLKVSFTSKHKHIAGKTFLQEQFKPPYQHMKALGPFFFLIGQGVYGEMH